MDNYKYDILVTKEMPLILSSTASPNEFGIMEVEKGAYIEIQANMKISIDVLKRPDSENNSKTDTKGPLFDILVKGRDGKAGESGENGKDGKNDGSHGFPGYPGEPGESGSNGPKVTITIGELQDSFSLQNVGGDGGNGGKGGDGGNGKGSNSNGGHGGDGGNGGEGGDGANLHIIIKSRTGESEITCSNDKSKGGDGGRPGSPGQNGKGGSPGEIGKEGVSGTRGREGATKIEYL